MGVLKELAARRLSKGGFHEAELAALQVEYSEAWGRMDHLALRRISSRMYELGPKRPFKPGDSAALWAKLERLVSEEEALVAAGGQEATA